MRALDCYEQSIGLLPGRAVRSGVGDREALGSDVPCGRQERVLRLPIG